MWVAGGTLHCFFEGYFVFNHATFGRSQFLFAQLWKEYVLSDSRYISGDPTVLCAEAVTMVVWGPLSYLSAFLILTSSPYRYPLQAIVSLGHLYGDVLYLSTSLVDLYMRGVSYSRPEAYYFWFYFLFLNLIWVFVPAGELRTTHLARCHADSSSSSLPKHDGNCDSLFRFAAEIQDLQKRRSKSKRTADHETINKRFVDAMGHLKFMSGHR